MAHITIGAGGYIPAENWRVWLPSEFPSPRRAIVACHGGGGEERFLDRDWHPQLHDTMVDVCERTGCAVLVPDHSTPDEPTGAHTWGNDASTDAVMAMLTWARATHGVSDDPVVVLGGSMGHLTGWNFARRFPGQVAGVVGVAGVCDLDYHHSADDSATGRYQSEIDAAHDGADYATVIGPTFDPAEFAAGLDLPWTGWFGDADPAIPLAGAQAFQALVGGDLHVVAEGNHMTTFGGIDADALVGFIVAL